MLGILTVNDIKYGDSFIGHGQTPLKAPNVEFDFDVKFLMYALGTACCQQIQIHQKCNILVCKL